jgi:hypothetical protein
MLRIDKPAVTPRARALLRCFLVLTEQYEQIMQEAGQPAATASDAPEVCRDEQVPHAAAASGNQHSA